jgi:hypothetical protein
MSFISIFGKLFFFYNNLGQALGHYQWDTTDVQWNMLGTRTGPLGSWI